jgi:peroxiredoxin
VPAPPRKAAYDDEEDDDEYDAPRPRSRPRRPQKSTGLVLILSVIGGCIAVFAAVAVLALFVWNKYLRENDSDVLGKNARVVGTKTGDPFGRAGANAAGTAPQLNRPAPDVEGTDASGKKVKLSDFRGKVVVLAFWSGRDKRSADSLTRLNELSKRLEGKKFALLGVNQDEKPDELKKAEREKHLAWPSIYDGPKGTISQDWGVNRLPAIFVIDSGGVLRYRDMEAESLDKPVNRLLRDMEGN